MRKTSTIAAALLLIASSTHAAEMFEPPVRLRADGVVIDTGEAWGHSSPCVVDLDGDGKRDLLVGDFSGTFTRYLNFGSASEPQYKADGKLQAGGTEAKVHIYCCIGAQPRVHDIDGDGVADLIANSYDPGHCYLMRGLADHQFAAVQEVMDKAGVPVRSSPVQQQNYQSFGSFYDAVDWDGDGDLDLLVGCFDGSLKVRMNEGSPKEMKWASENIVVEGPKVKAHFCPVVADWDGDGLFDVIAGSDDGSVTLFRNTGKKGSPAFAATGRTLVPEHTGNGTHGYNLLIWDDKDIHPGIRSQPEVVDYNGDGKLDLLVGDFYTAFDVRRDLSDEHKREVEQLTTASSSAAAAMRAKMDALQADFKKRYPGDAIFSDKADKEWSEAYKAMRESPEAKAMEAEEKEFTQKMRPFLATTRGEGDREFDLAKSHGHVWAFIRK